MGIDETRGECCIRLTRTSATESLTSLGRSSDAENGAGLSPTTTRPPGKSLTPSVRSSRSDITVVADRPDSDVSFKKRSPRRTKTQVHIVEPQVSRWTLFLGVFLGTKWACRRIKCNIRNEYDSDGEDDSDNESIEVRAFLSGNLTTFC